MNKVVLENGKWFDLSRTKQWKEALGEDRVSKATRRKYEHEALHRTRKGNWLVHSWSACEAVTSWREISERDALTWLVRNGHEPTSKMKTTHANMEI